MPETESPDEAVDLDLQHLSSVALGAAVVAALAAWIAADLASPVLVFAGVALLTGYFLADRRGDREKAVLVGWAVVALLAVSPVLFFLPDVVAGRTGLLGQPMTVVVVRLLLVVTGVVGYVVYRLDGGAGVVQRARDPDARRALAGYLVAAAVLALPFVLFLSDLLVGTRALGALSVLLWRLLGVVAVGIAYGAYRLDGGAGLLSRVGTATAESPDSRGR